MRILHDREFQPALYPEYQDEPYFRLLHPLVDIPAPTPGGISIVTATPKDIPHFADIINRSYTDLSVTDRQLMRYTQTEVFCSELWIAAVDDNTSRMVGCGIADLDTELQEGIIEWVQVLPDWQGKGIGQLIVTELLRRMLGKAEFATVSGKVNALTAPEKLYRKCGFAGEDIWHVLTRKD